MVWRVRAYADRLSDQDPKINTEDMKIFITPIYLQQTNALVFGDFPIDKTDNNKNVTP